MPNEENDQMARLTGDQREAAATLEKEEVRYLVDNYYVMQENRKRADNQVRAMSENGEPSAVIQWQARMAHILEQQIQLALNIYSRNNPLGQWARSNKGIGPVTTSGLLAHIDLERATTAGKIWRFAGLDPTITWYSSAAAKQFVREAITGRPTYESVAALASSLGRNPEALWRDARYNGPNNPPLQRTTAERVAKALSRRPWNASLKTLCWKIGESFTKVCNHEDAFYGHIYRDRKNLEWERNLVGQFSDQAASGAERVGNSTIAYRWYSAQYQADAVRELMENAVSTAVWDQRLDRVEAGTGTPMLPPGHIHSRAKRYAVKLYLAHFHEMGYRLVLNREPPVPYPIAHMDHADRINPPNVDNTAEIDDDDTTDEIDGDEANEAA